DVANLLAESLEIRGCRVRRGHRWAALPTVTATAKTAVSPAAQELVATEIDATFAPRIRATGKPAQAPALREAIQKEGYQVLDPSDLGMRAGENSKGWIEFGQIDERGHNVGAELARHIPSEVDRLATKIESLLK